MFGFLQVVGCRFEIEASIVDSTHHNIIELTNCTYYWHFKVVYLVHILFHSNQGVSLNGSGSPPPRIPFKSFHIVCFPSILVHTNVNILRHWSL
jgi:hypothetical protein